MKSASFIISNVVAVFLFCPGLIQAESGTGEVVVLVRLTDFAGATTFQTTTMEDYRGLTREAQKDNKALPVAYGNLRKNWRITLTKVEKKTIISDGKSIQVETKIQPPPFPLECPEPRDVRQMGTFASTEEADKLKKTLVDREAERVEKMTREKERKEDEKESRTGVTEMPGGLKRPPPKPSTKRPKPLSPVSAEDMLAKLLKEIETVKAADELANGAGGLRTILPTSTTKAKKEKKPPMKIKRIGD
jgi:hypothetical protein